jgi:hypothetical protein
MRSLFSAARAHSRLHQAAILAASSIKAVVPYQNELDSALLYLTQYGQHVNSLDVMYNFSWADQPTLCQLPHNKLQGLTSLKCDNLSLQLQPRTLSPGVLWAGAPLKRLNIKDCVFCEWEEGLAALSLLTDLQHLSFSRNHYLHRRRRPVDYFVAFPFSVLRPLQQLTYFKLKDSQLQDDDGLQVCPWAVSGTQVPLPWPSSMHAPQALRAIFNGQEANAGNPMALQYNAVQYGTDVVLASFLQGLTCLKELRLRDLKGDTTEDILLSGIPYLTCLMMAGGSSQWPFRGECVILEPDVLAGKTQLQRLELLDCRMNGGLVGTARLMLNLQYLGQLTYLSLHNCVSRREPSLAAAAFSALTASSKLQHLGVKWCMLPVDAWQHMFPVGRQLPHLTELSLEFDSPPTHQHTTPAGSRLVSCCPRLQSLRLWGLRCGGELLAPLTGLSSLQELSLNPPQEDDSVSTHTSDRVMHRSLNSLEMVCQLTGLRQLWVKVPNEDASVLPQLAQLTRLTSLVFARRLNGEDHYESFDCEVSSGCNAWPSPPYKIWM